MADSKIKIALVGAAGRMGLEVTRAAARDRDMVIVAGIERTGSPALGKDLGELAGLGPSGITITDNLEQAGAKADVIVDLSLPTATASVVEGARLSKKALVCGTTGLRTEIIDLFDSAALDIPVLYTPNLSLGVAVTQRVMEQAINALGPGYDIEIVEMHHRHKGDAPSGTAVALAKTAALAKGLDPEKDLCFGRFGPVGQRRDDEIGVHAVRGGGVFGEHTVILAGEHERIEITHRASSRALFAQGALKAARFIHSKPAGRYSMVQMLFPN